MNDLSIAERPSTDWALLQSFRSVAEHGTLTAAARALGLSQPTLGRHVRQLEEQIGDVLFRRTSSGFELTPRGTLLFEHVESMARGARAIDSLVRGFEEEVEGTVRIACANVFALQVLPHLLQDALDEHPGLEIEIAVTDAVQNLLRREADVAIRHFRSTQQDLVTSKIGEVDLGFFARDTYVERYGSPATLEELRDHRIIGFDRSSAGLDGARRLGLEATRHDFRLRTDSIPTQNAALHAGLGIGSAQVWLAERDPHLVRVLPDVTLGVLEIWIAAHDDLHRSPRIRTVYDALKAGLQAFFEDKLIQP